MTKRVMALLTTTILTLAACGPSTSNSTPPAPPNISGDYTGTVQDSVTGSLTATATLAQHGSTAGGTLSTTAGATTLISSITLAIAGSNALNGSMVQDLPGGATCTFSVSGSYTTTNQQIAGSYAAVTGCSGQSGTFTLVQQCIDTVTATARRTMGLAHC